MTHYLRISGKTIVDVEATKDDIQSVVCIDVYSGFLLREQTLRGGSTPHDLIEDFDRLQELRGAFHERPYERPEGETPDELAKRRLQEIARKYDLEYVTIR